MSLHNYAYVITVISIHHRVHTSIKSLYVLHCAKKLSTSITMKLFGRVKCCCILLCFVVLITLVCIPLSHLYLATRFPGMKFSLRFYGHHSFWQRQCMEVKHEQFQRCPKGVSQYNIRHRGSHGEDKIYEFLDGFMHFPKCDTPTSLTYTILGYPILCDGSSHAQSIIVWKRYFSNNYHGFYVDSGAFDGELGSSSLMFEKFGWTGLLVEPNEVMFKTLISKHRNAVALQACLFGPTVVDKIIYKQLTVPSDPTSANVGRSCGNETDCRHRNVPCFNLHKILEYMSVQTVDFLSLDVELAEISVLSSIPLDRIRFNVIMVECFSHNKMATEQFFAQHQVKYLKQFEFLESSIHKYDLVYVRADFATQLLLHDSPVIKYVF